MAPTPQSVLPARRMLLPAKIVFNRKSSVMDCLVRKLTADGAEITMKSTIGVPDAFELRAEQTGETLFCDVASRTLTKLEVRFQESFKSAMTARRVQ